MIHHVVLFALDGFSDSESRLAHLERIARALEALPLEIVELVSLEVRLNSNPKEDYDLMLVARVNSWMDLQAYSTHPKHVAVVTEFIKPYLEKRACVDYED